MNSLSILLDEPHINDVFNNQSSFKKAIKYEESWTKTFDTKFQVLGEFSKKNILTPEKVSFDSLFSAKSAVPSQSQTNSFVFTDFCIDKNCQSEKNVFDLGRSSCSNEVPLLDSFVDNPISHKLPNLVTSQKGISKSSYLMRSSEQMKRKLHLLKEEDQLAVGVDAEDSLQDTDISDKTQGLSKTSVIELKRNSNCSHSFAILYEKNIDCQREDPSMSSNDSLILVREKRKSKLEKHLISHGSHSSSREIVLGLWEHDKSILQEFCPELASSMPTLRMITTVEFVEDVKYLLTGINSGSFQYNTKENCFNMQYGTCLSDVTPESLFHFSKEFIETGNYYVKLSTFATENGKSNYKACTTINQVFMFIFFVSQTRQKEFLFSVVEKVFYF